MDRLREDQGLGRAWEKPGRRWTGRFRRATASAQSEGRGPGERPEDAPKGRGADVGPGAEANVPPWRPTERGSVTVLIPVYNDWGPLGQVLRRLDTVLAEHDRAAEVLIVDDGSTIGSDDFPGLEAESESDAEAQAIAETEAAAGAFASLSNCPETAGDCPNFARGHGRDAHATKQNGTVPLSVAVWGQSLTRIRVLRLRRNLGHQRAIAIGLAYIEDRLESQVVVVMDGDGEDDPADVPRLLDQLEDAGQREIVFAERTRRSEAFLFKVFYSLYRWSHHLLTGQKVRIGNFSAVPRRRLSSLVVVAELWNHYAAAVVRSRQPYRMVPTRRARRLGGHSKMNFVALVAHGLSAISVQSDIVGVRLLVVSALLALLSLGGIVAALVLKLTTDLAIPGWATTAVGLLLVLLGQAVTAAFLFSFMVLGARNGSTFLPVRDYAFYIEPARVARGGVFEHEHELGPERAPLGDARALSERGPAPAPASSAAPFS